MSSQGVTSWLSLVFPHLEWAFGFLRDAYEAYAVYTFFGLLMAVLEDGRGYEYLVETLAQHVEEEQRARTFIIQLLFSILIAMYYYSLGIVILRFFRKIT